jgi:hypothetical protein
VRCEMPTSVISKNTRGYAERRNKRSSLSNRHGPTISAFAETKWHVDEGQLGRLA